MQSISLMGLQARVKKSDAGLAKCIKYIYRGVRSFELPNIKYLYLPLYSVTKILKSILNELCRIFFYSPAFKSVIHSCGSGLILEGGVPQILGNLRIQVGNNCRISGVTTFSGRTSSVEQPSLTIGNNVDVSWMTSISVGSKVELQDNVRIAGRCYLAGYPGHPIDADDRALGKPELDSQVGDIVLERDVWVGTGCFIKSGVTIGQGTIVAANSVVVKSMPENSLIGGNPAVVIKQIAAKGGV